MFFDIVTILKTKDITKSTYHYKDEIKCLQQSAIADNDGLEFLQPMAEYMAEMMLNS